MIILLFLISFAFADEDRNMWEKTNPHDRNVCYLDKKRLEVVLKGFNRIVDVHHLGFSEYGFYSTSDNESEESKYYLLPFKRDGFETYKFFSGPNETCSKQLVFRINSRTFALLFLKDNRPSPEKLVILLFDTKKMKPKEVIDTLYMTDEAEATKDGFVFKSLSDRDDDGKGYVRINGVKYLYHSQNFSPWIYYTSEGFKTSGSYSFERFKWKSFFKNKKDFHRASGWIDNTNEFQRPFLYHAINHDLKKECVLFTSSRRRLEQDEKWRCGQII